MKRLFKDLTEKNARTNNEKDFVKVYNNTNVLNSWEKSFINSLLCKTTDSLSSKQYRILQNCYNKI